MPNQPVMTVLIFEDPKATQKVPHPLLTEMGLRLLWSPVRSAQEALFALWQHKPSIVIVDAKLGDGSDGREIIDALVDAQALRATGNFGEPVVVRVAPGLGDGQTPGTSFSDRRAGSGWGAILGRSWLTSPTLGKILVIFPRISPKKRS